MKSGRKRYGHKDEKGNYEPTKEELQAIELIIEADKTYTEICEIVNISRATLNNWFHKEEFVDILNKERKIARSRSLPEIDKSIHNKAIGKNKDVDVSACRTIYELSGELNKEKEEQAITFVMQVPRPKTN